MTYLRVLFDLTVNDGWNGVAIAFYMSIAVIIATWWMERKTND